MTSSPVSVYLGSDHNRWRPRTWQDVVDAAAGGLLNETSYVELKRELSSVGGRAQNNIAIAKDLAAMAVDGGMLVFGVEDDDSRAGNVVGVELKGLADRIDQIAKSRVHPPLTVRTKAIDDPTRPGYGCLLVLIPPSPQAPHMVENVYYGRSDKGNERLTDEMVRRIMASRDLHAADIRAELRELASRDPFPPQRRETGHLYVLVRPAAGNDEALVEFLTADSMVQGLHGLLSAVAGELGHTLLPQADTMRRRAEGVVLSRYYGRSDDPESALHDLALREDGTITLMSSKPMEIRTANPPLNERQTIVWTPHLLGMVHATVRFAGLLADQHTGYQGLWNIGVRIEGLGGSVPVEAIRDPDLFTYDRYDLDVYERVTTATTGDLVDQAPAVVERLLATLLRGLRIDTNYLPYSAEVLRSALR